ncbi:uncharacterized protein BDCG_17849 [Blastomyces dermatitidis ER-3]|uniref:Uncharacterized protein n=1 Tax=Ajellomyces dermatitidis (strain ER-3 / ATCC MYA-2586) TaxID=559297 RepID=A0ABX2W0N5_AJEDR|nr:uncharacterized protein BDCG_17849 [Blastomyces dermatitidis ER-3]OAT02946.1 hypothetical protein BDCG_17849 [Blastomyces dermatitidis ER-3]
MAPLHSYAYASSSEAAALLSDGLTTTTAAKEAGEEEDVIMRVMLSQLIDTAVFTFNLAFLTVMKATAAS